MGTHPIFESDFDCLTEKQNMIRYAGKHSTTPPEPTVRPVYENLELTVPEPSLFEMSDVDESSSAPVTSTQLPNVSDKSVKFNLTEQTHQYQRKSRKSEPILHSQSMPTPQHHHQQQLHHQQQQLRQSYYENYYMAPVPPPPPPPQQPAQQNGVMELIEVIRKQEIEIHKHKIQVNKQVKQLKQQAELIQNYKSRLTQNEQQKEGAVSVTSQTDELKMTPISVQTDPDEPVVLIGADATTQTEEDVKPEPVVVVEEKPIEMEEEHEQRQTDSDESEPDLSPEELRNLLDELNRSTRTAKEPSPVKTPPPPPQRSEQSMFLAKLAPSYGAHVLAGAGDRSLLKQADESICGALAKKYGIQASAASTPLRQHHHQQQHHNESHTMSGDVSIATANYLYRHGFQNGGGEKKQHQQPQKKKKEIINYAELEKIEKYT